MKLLVANWKDNPATPAEAMTLAKSSDFSGMVICPPHRFLGLFGSGLLLKHAVLGAQDYAPDIHTLGCRYVIIGHSDRRRLGDTDVLVAEKMACAVSDDLTPILCVGETAEQRVRGEAEPVITEQLRVGLSKIQHLKSEIWIAYEPVWAISSELNAQPETPVGAAARIAFLKEQALQLNSVKLTVHNGKFLYGGSITSVNAYSFLEQSLINGLLVGAASVQPIEIQKIWQLTQRQENNN